MAQFISFQPSDYFTPLLHTGNGSELVVSGVGFQPDFTWIKNRTNTDYHVLTDSVRGATKYVRSNGTTIETTDAEGLKSFDSDGYTLGTQNQVNENTANFVGWNWKAGTTSGIATNGSTTITPSSYSFDQTAGISVLNYTGNITSGAKLAHGLGATPDFVMIKSLGATKDWGVYNKGMNSYVDPEDYGIELNDAAAQDNSDSYWNDTVPDSVNLTLGNGDKTNHSSGTMIAYCFAEKTGYSKFGSYSSNNTVKGPFIYTGFRPVFTMIKDNTGGNPWVIDDVKRETYNEMEVPLKPNNTDADYSGSAYGIDLLSNGFKIRNNDSTYNGTGNDFIYAAFAEAPLVNSSGVPVNAR